MPRVTPSDRIPKLLDAAAAAFVEHGFHRTQMDDVAERLGVSKGTIYRTVDSKEALFAAVVEWGDNPDEVPAAGVNGTVDLAAVAAVGHRTARCGGRRARTHDDRRHSATTESRRFRSTRSNESSSVSTS